MLDKLEKDFRFFLCVKDGTSRGLALVSWDKLCRPKEQGGMGLHTVKKYQLALQTKITVRCVQSVSLWATVTKQKYGV